MKRLPALLLLLTFSLYLYGEDVLYQSGPQITDTDDTLLFLKNLQDLSSIEIIIPLTVTFNSEDIPQVEDAWLGWGKAEDSLPLCLQDIFGLSIISKIQMLEVSSPARLWSSGIWDNPIIPNEADEAMHYWASRFIYSRPPIGLEKLFAEERVIFRQQTEIWMEAPPSPLAVVSEVKGLEKEKLMRLWGHLTADSSGNYTFHFTDGSVTDIVVKNPSINLEKYTGTEMMLLATAENRNPWILKIYGINSEFIQ